MVLYMYYYGASTRGVNLSFASTCTSECANRSNWIRQYKHYYGASTNPSP